MAMLRDSLKIVQWSDIFGHSFRGNDFLGGAPQDWFLRGVGLITGSSARHFTLKVFVSRRDGMEANKFIRSKDKNFLENLAAELKSVPNISWEQLGLLGRDWF